jgi:endonuclease/exonuclease/phosphatase family metal-dependent hydrolase
MSGRSILISMTASLLLIAACSSSDSTPINGGDSDSGSDSALGNDAGADSAGDGDASTAEEQVSNGQLVKFDTFNLYLAGAFAPFEAERRDKLIAAIANLDSDIVCLQEAWAGSDKQLIANAAQSTFPNVVMFTDNLETPVDDPTDQNGNTPATPTTAPCQAQEQADKLEATLQCVMANCSTIPGSEDGKPTSTSCAATQCTSEAAALMMGSDADKKCYGCAATLLPTDTIKQIREKCTTDPHAGLAFDGQAGVMLLSKFPLENGEQRVIPGTWNRRIIVRATAKLTNGASLDVYCNHLPSIFYDQVFPYTGDYGNGNTDYKGWEAELMLDAQKLVTWVETKTGTGRAIVLGDFNASPQIDAQNIEPDGATAYAFLTGKLTEALPSGFTPACTYCGKSGNVLAAGGPGGIGPNTWIDHIFMKNMDVAAVKAYARTFTEATVPIPADDAGDGGSSSWPSMVTLSDHYGVHTEITIAP